MAICRIFSMDINYGTSKEVKCYRDFVQNPDDRSSIRAFVKMFGKPLLEPAKRLHDRLSTYPSAGDYNKVYGTTDNRIDLMQGVADKNPLILKVRVGRGPRKFFHQIINECESLIKKDWKGDFNSVTSILVIEINNHDYNF